MSKKTKKKKKKSEKEAKPPRKTIKTLVLKTLAKKPDISAKEMREIVIEQFPDSAFGKSHLAWYKSKVRRGDLELPGGATLPPSTRGRKKAEKEKSKKAKKSKKKKRTRDEDEEDEE